MNGTKLTNKRAGIFSPTLSKIALATGVSLLTTFGALAVEPMSVEGNQVLIGGKEGSVAGPSLFWSSTGWGGDKFYTPEIVSKAKNEWGAKLIRAAMGADVDKSGGYLTDKSNLDRVKTVVNAAIAEDMYVIIDWHSHNAPAAWGEARSFFEDMAREYGQHDNVIYEIYNEPVADNWSNDVKPYAEDIIDAIRAIDPDNLIVVGTPNWSQDVDAAADDPIQGRTNVAYTLHFYANGHRQWLRDKAQYALDKGIALFATEWGTVEPIGNGPVDHAETALWMEFLKKNNISHAAWSVNDKHETASMFFPGTQSLTESGNLVVKYMQEWAGEYQSTTCDDESVVAFTLPGKVEAEDYCEMSGIQTEASTDAGDGENIGYLDAGDYVKYKVDAPSAGEYTIKYRVASLMGSDGFKANNGEAVQVPNTGDWQAWETLEKTIQLSQGEQIITLDSVGEGWNLNWFEISGNDLADFDEDGVADSTDNCYEIPNSDQADNDADFMGDACDEDDDNDGFSDLEELNAGSDPFDAASVPTLLQDSDNDGIANHLDNCPMKANKKQWDYDKDGMGNACDNDDDNDTFTDKAEKIAGTNPKDPKSFPGSITLDNDGDGIDDVLDNCPSAPNKGQWDLDGDGQGNKCDLDDDGDGFSDEEEIMKGTNPRDKNSKPGTITLDIDGDGIADAMDNCPSVPNKGQWDFDADGQGNACDLDDDNDGFTDVEEKAAGTHPRNAESFPVQVVEEKILVSENGILVANTGEKKGFSLYVFDLDPINGGVSKCNHGCAATWPPLLASDGDWEGIEGVTTVTRDDGSLQVAYQGRPLYFYFQDTKAGDTLGHTLGSVWWLANP